MIDTIGNAELKNKEEDLLKNMKMLRHTVANMLGSKSFLKGFAPGAQNGIIGIDGETFPVYITANTLAADGLPEITDDIYDEDNYLSLVSDDDLMWYALVEHLAVKMENLYKENESIKEELNAADNEIEGLEESLREANKKCTEYTRDIDKLEVDNKRLSERVKTLVIEKTNRPDTAEKVSDPKEDIDTKDLDMTGFQILSKITELENENGELKKKLFSGVPTKFGEQERGTPEDKVVRMDLETALMQQQITQLNTRIAQLEEKLKSTETELTTAMNANGILKTQIAALTDEKKEAELLAYRLTRGDMHVQFDNMKSLEHENGVLKNENADLNQKLVDSKDYNKRLRQEITKLRVQLNSYSGATVVNNEDMQQTITKEAMSELTARINELESTLKDKDERINQLSKINAGLSTENKNFGELLREADRTSRFYAREVDNLEKEIKDLKLEAAKSDEDSDSVLEPHVVTANDNMQYTVSLETMNELTARIKELESINENLQEENESLKKKLDAETAMINSTISRNEELETENKELRKDNEDFTSIAEAHIETTTKFADYKEKQKRLYKHFKNLAEMIEDLMEMG